MGRNRRPRELHCPGVSVDVIVMAVGVDDVRDGQALLARSLDKHVRRIGGIDQDGAAGIAIADQVPEIAVATRANLFEDQLHASFSVPFTRAATA
jgi:hypothetical protein